ncbi:MAG: hypothetical protein IJL74_03385 [Bacilli bacterium]|nr:hypothetical protein [Bacilli bacterium]
MKKFGDRRDGKKLKNLNGMMYVMSDIKKKRADREVYIDYPIDVTELLKYREKLNKKKDRHITIFHLFSTGIAKVIYNRPQLNIFIINGKFYQRNDVVLSFVAKTEFTDTAEELMQILKVEENDNIFTLSEKISGNVKKARTSSQTGGDKLVSFVGHMPKILRRPVVGMFMLLDRHDLLPSDLANELLYYSSVILSNIGAIGCTGGIYHNITDFGTNSILATMGKIYKKEVVNDDGTKEIRDFCDFGMTLDEGIADGFYMIKSMQLFQYIMNNPKLLEGNANEKIEIK